MREEDRQSVRELLARCHDNPDLFNTAILGRPKYWWRQSELCRAAAKHKTVLAVSGNSVGKDYWIGGIVPWWLWTRPRSLVFVTGPGQTVLSTVTWKEIRRAISNARFPMGADVTQAINASPLKVSLGDGWQAIGFSTTTIERASGQHDPNLLVIGEEASGLTDDVAETIRGLNPAKLILIGNPLRADGWFNRLHKRAERERDDPTIKESERVVSIVIPSTDSPDIDLERSHRGLADKGFLDEAERDYGRDSLWWTTHVLAQFPDVNVQVLLQDWWVDRLTTTVRDPEAKAGRIRLGCDLGEGTGRDSTTIVVRDDLGIHHAEDSDRMGIPQAAHRIAQLAKEFVIEPADIVYDAGGRGKDLAKYLEMHGITGATPYHGSGSGGEKFLNRRAKTAWKLRQRLDPERPIFIDPEYREPPKISELYLMQPPAQPRRTTPQPAFTLPPSRPWWPRLASELKAIKYEMKGPKIALENKEELTARLGRSPDMADAFIMTFHGVVT